MSNKEEKAGKHGGTRARVPRLRFPEFREAGEWEGVLLGEICQPQQWPTISSTDLVDVGYPVYGANGFIGY
jgi:type I restriction enzyme S subunit